MKNYNTKYQNPKLEIIKLNNNDIILTSNQNQDPNEYEMGKIKL